MKLADIFKRENIESKNNINRVPQVFDDVGGWCFDVSGKRYADAYLWLVFNKIFQGLRNVSYVIEGDVAEEYSSRVNYVRRFIETNINTIVWEWWKFGLVAIDVDRDGNLYFPKVNKSRFDNNRNVTNCFAVIYSDSYIYSGKSSFDILKENVANLDTIKNGQDYLTRTFGSLGILSAKNNPIYEDDKNEFNEKVKKDYGISSDKYQILLFDTDVNFQKLELPIKDLDLGERIKDELKLIAGFFGVPYDLIPFAGASTYANQEQAVKQFYSGCISPLAEIGLQIGRYIIRRQKNLHVVSDVLTFRIDNVPEIEDDRMTEINYKSALVDLIAKMEAAGLDATEEKNKLK